MLEKDFWQDKSNSQKIIKEKKLFEDLINSYDDLDNKLSELSDLYVLASEENNSEILSEVGQNIVKLRLIAKKMR